MTSREQSFIDGLWRLASYLLFAAIAAACFAGILAAANGANSMWAAGSWDVAHHVRAQIDASFSTYFWWTLGAICALVAIEFASFQLSNESWRSLVPAFIWPAESKVEINTVGRMGRVIHWIFAVVAAACLVGCAFYIVTVQSSIREAKREQALWDQDHPGPGDGYVVTSAPARNPTYEGDRDYRPYVPKSDHGIALLITALLASISLLIGRGFRYILSGE